MSKARLVLAWVVIAITGLATACGSGSASVSSAGGTIPLLRGGLSGAHNTLDLTRTINATAITQLCLDTLMKFGPQGQLEPNLAASVSQPSPTTYVYHLRQGVKFWEGHELTAADVVYSLNYERSAASQVAFAFASVESITATGQYTVQVTLNHPDAGWQYVPAEINAEIFEKQFAEEHQGTFGNPGVLLMGTGPWKVDSLDPAKNVQLSANPHWWGGKVPIDRISFTLFSSDTSEALAFRGGQIDFAPQISGPKSFAATSGAKLLSTPSCGMGFFGMNVLTPPWNDVHVRRAVAYAVNRSDIIASGGGYATPIDTYIPPQLLKSIASQSQIDALLKSLPLYPYSPAKAKQELAQSAYPNGVTATLLQFSGFSQADNLNQVFVAQLQKVGIKLEIKTLEVTAWQAVESGPAKDRATALTTGGCFNPDPSTYYDFLGSSNLTVGNWNFANYAPPAVDDMLTGGIATTDPAKRFEVFSKLLARLQTDVPYIGLYVQNSNLALSSKYKYPGFSFWPYNDGPYLLNVKPA